MEPGNNISRTAEGTHSTRTNQSTTASFGRFTVAVVASTGEKGKVAMETRVEHQGIGIFERLWNAVTGYLDREKNEALINFIKTGEAGEDDQSEPTLDQRLHVLESILSGKTKATYKEKLSACEAMQDVMRSLGANGPRVPRRSLVPVAPKYANDGEVVKALHDNIPVLRDVVLSSGDPSEQIHALADAYGIDFEDVVETLHYLLNRSDDYNDAIYESLKRFVTIRLGNIDRSNAGTEAELDGKAEEKAAVENGLRRMQQANNDCYASDPSSKEKEALANAIFDLLSLYNTGKTVKESVG